MKTGGTAFDLNDGEGGAIGLDLGSVFEPKEMTISTKQTYGINFQKIETCTIQKRRHKQQKEKATLSLPSNNSKA